MVDRSGGRLPDFILIGGMKCGTSTLYRWLCEHPLVVRAATKEPCFFGDESKWRRGIEWYRSLFPVTDQASLTGEGSTHYTWPTVAPMAARRARAVVPEAKLICVLREPEARIRSHYRHAVQRRQERRPFPSAMRRSQNIYLQVADYARGLRPWMTEFPRDQLLLVRFEDLYDPQSSTWEEVLRHLGLPAIPRPTTDINRSGQQPRLSPLRRAMADSVVVRGLVSRVPQAARHKARQHAPWLMGTRGGRYERLIQSSTAPVPTEVDAELQRIKAELVTLPGADNIRWDD